MANNNNLERAETLDPADTGITTINNDSEVVVSIKNEPIDLPLTFRQSSHITSEQGIRDFLARPRQLTTGSWTTASASPLNSFSLPFDLINDTLFSQKIQGFLGFRATAVVRVQLNATRFQQGRLILHHVPHNVPLSTNPAVWSGWKGALTQHPNVQLDANCDTEAVLKIPYISPSLAYDLQDGTGSFGLVYLSIYSALAYGSGSTSVEYTIWGSFEDVELFGPTLTSSYIPQSGKGMTASAKESKQVGPISGVASAVSGIGKALSKFAPLSAIGGTTSWIADLVSDNAKAFGFSKPNSLEPAMRMRGEQAPFHNQADNAEAANVMALCATNSVGVLPGASRTDTDELLISHFAAIPSYYTEFNWTTSNDTGTTLIPIIITPETFRVSHTDTGTGASQVWYENTPISYVGGLFNYWRGSVRLTFKFPKTEFHSGRLVATFVPSDNYVGSYPTLNNGAYLLREIFDMRISNEFTVIVPYIATKPWMERNESTGTLYIQVLNELVAPSTVASSIAVLVEVSAGPDFEVAVPGATNWQPYIPKTYTVQSGSGLLSLPIEEDPGYESDDEYHVQSGPGMKQDPCALVHRENVIGGASIRDDAHTNSMYCIGEKITSFRQLIKRRCRLYNPGTQPTSTLCVDPFFMQFCSYSGTTGLVQPALYGDILNSLLSIFAFNSGSVRFYWYDRDPTASVDQIDAYYRTTVGTTLPYYAVDGGTTYYAVMGPQGWVSHSFHRSGIPEFECPQYHRFGTRYAIQTATDATYGGMYASRGRLAIEANHTVAANKSIFARSAGEDFQFYNFISIPPMIDVFN